MRSEGTEKTGEVWKKPFGDRLGHVFFYKIRTEDSLFKMGGKNTSNAEGLPPGRGGVLRKKKTGKGESEYTAR